MSTFLGEFQRTFVSITVDRGDEREISYRQSCTSVSSEERSLQRRVVGTLGFLCIESQLSRSALVKSGVKGPEIFRWSTAKVQQGALQDASQVALQL